MFRPCPRLYTVRPREDFVGITNLLRTAFDDLLREHGFWESSPFALSRLPPVPVSGPFPWFEMGLKEDRDGFWVAEQGSELAGVALSWVRGGLWYLAHLFVLPKYQGHDIGRNLMDRAMEHGREFGITNRALVTLSYNPVSIILYTRYGIYPREPLYWMECPVENVKRLSQGAGLKSERREDFGATRKTLRMIDERCLGYPRDRNHEYLFSLPTIRCYIFSSREDPVGYAYVAQNGRVGPLATVSKDSFKDVAESALRLAALEEKASSVSVLTAGSNEELMKLALRIGMRIRDNSLFMSSMPFPNFSNYILYPTSAML